MAAVECRYFRSGFCRYGSDCRFSHTQTTPSATTSSPAGSSSSPSSSSSSAAARCKALARVGGLSTAVDEKFLNANAPVFVPRTQPSQSSSAAFRLDSGDHPNLRIIDDDIPAEERDETLNSSSYADICKKNLPPPAPEEVELIMCPFMLRNEQGMCVYGDTCEYVHGDQCDLCGLFCLNPVNEESRKKHQRECLAQHEKDMELSFAIARSRDKCCGICMEVVLEKQGVDQRFGILQNCNHVFCLECIRKWRQNKEKHFNNEIARACPECRTASDFICPSTYWVGDVKEEKDKLINGYKHALGDKHCKYFKNGDGKCPFGNKCFYKHWDKFGRQVDVGDPKKFVRRYMNADELIRNYEEFLLLDVIESLDRLSTDDSEFDEEFDDDVLEHFRALYR